MQPALKKLTSNFFKLKRCKYMQKIEIFVGPPMSGKTSTARALAEGKKTTWLLAKSSNPIDNPRLLAFVQSNDEMIVVDDIYSVSNLKLWIDAALTNELMHDKKVILICYSSITKVNLEEYFNQIEIRHFTIPMGKRYYYKIVKENKPGNTLEGSMLQELKIDERQIVGQKELSLLKGNMKNWIESQESMFKRCKPGTIKPQWTLSSDKKDEFCYVGGLCIMAFYLIEEKEVSNA